MVLVVVVDACGRVVELVSPAVVVVVVLSVVLSVVLLPEDGSVVVVESPEFKVSAFGCVVVVVATVVPTTSGTRAPAAPAGDAWRTAVHRNRPSAATSKTVRSRAELLTFNSPSADITPQDIDKEYASSRDSFYRTSVVSTPHQQPRRTGS